jgi:type II secretory pathway pseudopilin PulG
MNMNLRPKATSRCLKENGQAVTELAILGALIIVAFSFLINYSEKLNRQQANIQQTFRLALEEAGKANNYATYTKRVFMRMPNVANPMELGQLEHLSDTSHVLWQDGRNRDDVYVYDETNKQWYLVARYPRQGVKKYQFNDWIKDYSDEQNDYGGDGNLIVPVETFTKEKNTEETIVNTTAATTTLTQLTGEDGPVTRKALVARDDLTANISIEDESYEIKQALGDGGVYSSDGGGIIR